MLGVYPTSRKTESVERFQRNWTKLFQVVEVWIELVFGLSEITKKNPCFPDPRSGLTSGLPTIQEVWYFSHEGCLSLLIATLTEGLRLVIKLF